MALRPQHGQEIAVAAQDFGLELDPRRYVLFVDHFALSNDGIGQLDRSAIQEHHVDPVRLESAGQFVGKTSLNSSPIDGPINQYGQIIVTHWPQVALDL